MTERPIHVETIGDMLDFGYRLNAWCESCTTSRPVDLRRAAMKVGAGVRPRDLKLKCTGCGGRQVSISVVPPKGY